MSSPNVLLVLLDDVGFGAPSAFGGPCQTPTAERLAAGGLRYVRFHTTGLCSPTRASLLTGRNHHAVGFGSITETATKAAGFLPGAWGGGMKADTNGGMMVPARRRVSTWPMLALEPPRRPMRLL